MRRPIDPDAKSLFSAANNTSRRRIRDIAADIAFAVLAWVVTR